MEHRAGCDATFSAPKSVSITALVGGDTRVRVAHRESVRVALTELEPYVQARLGGNRRPETTGNAVAALFEHDSARPVNGYPAPQLHTHAVILPVSRDTYARCSVEAPELTKSNANDRSSYVTVTISGCIRPNAAVGWHLTQRTPGRTLAYFFNQNHAREAAAVNAASDLPAARGRED